jgi:Domain of unknown function (DUF4838)
MKMSLLLYRWIFGMMLMAGTATVSALDLVHNGKSDYVIVQPANATIVEKTAAEELAHFIKSASGAKLPIQGSAQGKPAIYLGRSAELKARLKDVDFNKFKPDEIILRTDGKDLFLTGDRPCGTLYAVYEFLETQLGIRFWSYDDTYIPKKANISISKLNIRYVPPFFLRDSYCTAFNENPIFAARHRINGQIQKIPPEYGGNMKILGFTHTFSRLLRPKKYFAKHPDWYAMRDGKRIKNGQLCLTNDAAFKMLMQQLESRIRKDPKIRLVSVSQNDNNLYCECPKCNAWVAQNGNQTDMLLNYVNKAATYLEKEFPHISVTTLAYHYTNPPPKTIRPRKNVIIRLCLTSNGAVYKANSEQNAVGRDEILTWEKYAHRLFIWYYRANYRNFLVPVPNFHTLGADLEFFANHHVKGMFAHGVYGAGEASELAPLRAWLTAKLLWNPQLDQKKLMREFIRSYYGVAAVPFIFKYIKLMSREAIKSGIKSTRTTPDPTKWLPLKAAIKGRELMQQALAATTDQKQKERVHRAGLAIQCALLFYDPKTLRAHNIDIKKEFMHYREATSTLVRLFSEKGGFDTFIRNMECIVNPQKYGKTPDVCADLSPDTWLELPAYTCALTILRRDVSVVSDPTSACGKVAKLSNTRYQWAIQARFLPLGKYDIYVTARWDSDNPGLKDKAIEAGVFNRDPELPRKIKTRILANKNVGKTYKTFLIGTNIELNKSSYLYVAGLARPAVKAVYVDRFILIKK